jgi:hypothetical protein
MQGLQAKKKNLTLDCEGSNGHQVFFHLGTKGNWVATQV